MAESRWVYRISDGRFLYGGFSDPSFNPATEAVAVFPDADPHPTPTERYDAGSPRLRRPATQIELDEDAAAAADADADLMTELKQVRAMIRWVMRYHTGAPPTAPQVQAEMDRWKAIFRALP